MSLTPKQEEIRLQRIHQASNLVRDLLHAFCFETDLATEHLERAKAHLDEAWIDADGQKARTVNELVRDIQALHDFDAAIAAAKPGQVIEAFGKRWKVGTNGGPGVIRSATSVEGT